MAKDRSTHEAARGVKQVAIADLSKQRPSEEQLAAYPSLILAGIDRGAAVMGGALVENALELAIQSTIVDPGDVIRKSWFEGPLAPFSTFSAKITLGRALGLYGERMQKRLASIKDIRNAFAHSSIPLDFKNPSIARGIKNLAPRDAKELRSEKIAYGAACVAVSKALVAVAFKNGGREITLHLP